MFNKTHNEYWIAFKSSFKKQIELQDLKQLDQAWKSQSDRTKWYQGVVLPKVAEEMGLLKGNELFKVDFAFSTIVNDELVPMVFIESENQAVKAEEEIRKLCSLHAPLKVMIICYSSNEKKKNDLKRDLMPVWGKIIAAHHESREQDHVIGIIVAEFTNPQYVFRCAAFSAGILIEPLTLLLNYQTAQR